jgi:hypothetical protein
MIDKPIYRRLLAAVGEADGDLALSLALHELSDIFEEFGAEVDKLYLDDPHLNDCSKGYYMAASWLNSWALEVDYSHGRP